jgi:hypothetical protein
MAQSRMPKLSRRAEAVWVSPTDDRFMESMKDLPGGLYAEIHLAQMYPFRRRLLLDLVNMRDDGEKWFWQTWERAVRPELGADVLRLRDELRTIWEDRRGNWANAILNSWLAWGPSPAHLKLYKNCPLPHPYYGPFHCFVDAGRLVPDPASMRPGLIQGVLEHWPNFKHCANPDCAAPYFIAKRKDQTVCDAEICKAEKQRQHALNWWRENRAKKPQKEAVSKTEKKGSKGNVTRKAR